MLRPAANLVPTIENQIASALCGIHMPSVALIHMPSVAYALCGTHTHTLCGVCPLWHPYTRPPRNVRPRCASDHALTTLLGTPPVSPQVYCVVLTLMSR